MNRVGEPDRGEVEGADQFFNELVLVLRAIMLARGLTSQAERL